ncbi:MAG: hypothetical protein ABSD28_08850 [Tepidisphaeraceae bacterium]|jgi:hypothetical protein
MTTDTQNSNASGTPSHPEQAAPSTDNNTRRLYEVTVHRTDYREARIHVEAKSEDEAGKLAEDIAERQKDSQWNVVDRDLYAFEVEQMKEGGSNE